MANHLTCELWAAKNTSNNKNNIINYYKLISQINQIRIMLKSCPSIWNGQDVDDREQVKSSITELLQSYCWYSLVGPVVHLDGKTLLGKKQFNDLGIFL